MRCAAIALALALTLATGMLAVAPAYAQAPEPSLDDLINEARKKIEGGDTSNADLQKLIEGLGAGYGEYQDYRVEMRRFVQNISDYSHTLDPKFIIVAEDALNLLRIIAPEEENHLQPAEDFINNIDGILAYEITTTTGKPLSEEAMIERDDSLDVAEAYDLPLMVVEFASGPETVNEVYRTNKERGLLSFVTGDKNMESIPTHPSEPYANNSASTTDISNAKNFLYIENSKGFDTFGEYVGQIRDTNFDVVVMDIFHNKAVITREQVAALKYKKIGAKRLVLAHMEIAKAHPEMYYWHPDWKPGAPAFLDIPNPKDPGNYYVRFWQPEWQDIFFGSNNSFIGGLVDLGFDGVVVHGLDAWKHYEIGGDVE